MFHKTNVAQDRSTLNEVSGHWPEWDQNPGLWCVLEQWSCTVAPNEQR